MKHNMKTLLTIILFFAVTQISIAQKVQYTYDNHGNRIQRKLVASPWSERLGNATPEEIEENSKVAIQEGISVFPNPTSDKVVLTINDFDPSETNSMSLLDAKGIEVMSQRVTQNNSEMDVSQFKSGIYYFKVVKNKKMLYYKLIKVD